MGRAKNQIPRHVFLCTHLTIQIPALSIECVLRSLQRAIRFAFGCAAPIRACRFVFLDVFRVYSARWLMQVVIHAGEPGAGPVRGCGQCECGLQLGVELGRMIDQDVVK
jgi:hypothetical protein